MKINKNLRLLLYEDQQMKVVFRVFGLNKLGLAIFGGLFDLEWRGVIVGFVIGCFMDMEYTDKSKQQRGNKKHDFRVSFLMLGAFVMQTPGVGSRISGTALRNALVNTFGETYTQRRMSFFYELLRQRIQVEVICEQLKQHATVGEKNTLLRFLFELGSQPGVNTDNLHHSINYLAARMEIPFETVQQIYRMVNSGQQQQYSYKESHREAPRRPEQQPPSLNALFATLKLSPNATEKEVKRAYYKLAKQFHPDSNPHASPQEKKQLEAQLRVVIEAYEQICESKGWK